MIHSDPALIVEGWECPISVWRGLSRDMGRRAGRILPHIPRASARRLKLANLRRSFLFFILLIF
jgi:hypothetical protein